MYIYSAYGLGIHSKIALPELNSGDRSADVVVRLGIVADHPPLSPEGQSWYRISTHQACLIWAGVGAFLIQNGEELVVERAAGSEDDLLRQAIMGPVMGLLLQQRKRYPLHASVIGLDGNAYAFAGDSGSGKSTLAVALYSRGHRLLSDDIAAIDPSVDPPRVFPGLPHFRLWPESATSFGEKVEFLPPLHSQTEKRLLAVSGGFEEFPRSLKNVYLLADDSRELIEPLTPQEALLELLRLCYNGALIKAAIGLPAMMCQCAAIAGSTNVYRLKRRRSLSALADLAQMLEDHFGRVT